jgi:uncharacterized protein (TIGR00255 family)
VVKLTQDEAKVFLVVDDNGQGFSFSGKFSSEELDRLRSHVQQFTKLLDGAGELGKKLDFLLQEMHREANTMLSKTPGVESEALAITGLSLEIRAEIEKLREQVQNIE